MTANSPGGSSADESNSVLNALLPNSKQLEDNVVRCYMCVRREQQLFAARSGFGHQILLSISTSALNRHLKEAHSVKATDETEKPSTTPGRQSTMKEFAEAASYIQPAISIET